MDSAHGVGTVHLHPLGGFGDAPRVPTMHLDVSTGHGPRSALANKSFLPWGLLGGLLPPILGAAQA
jgi:hypothetical protein